VGTVHSTISNRTRREKKISARLELDHLERLWDATNIPQPFCMVEQALRGSNCSDAVYYRVCILLEQESNWLETGRKYISTRMFWLLARGRIMAVL